VRQQRVIERILESRSTAADPGGSERRARMSVAACPDSSLLIAMNERGYVVRRPGNSVGDDTIDRRIPFINCLVRAAGAVAPRLG